MPDDAILSDLALKLDEARRRARLTDEELAQRGGTSRVAIVKLRSGAGGVSLKTFIRILRGLGRLDRLERLFAEEDAYRPSGAQEAIPRKRVRHSRKQPEHGFTWDEDA